MNSTFNAVPICDDVYWVGGIDWAIRDFHGYLTSRGTTYNAYLVLADKVTLIDTVKAPFVDEMLARIGSVIEPSKIDYIVSNHAEPDHAGGLAETARRVQPEKIFASARGVEALRLHFHDRLGEILPVEDGGKLSLGNMSLAAFATRLCHWPESMMTWLAERNVLFSQDVCGMHLACYERFDDQLPLELLDSETAKYFANILMPLTTFVAREMDRLVRADLPIKLLAPDHGPVRRKHIGRVIDQYVRWAGQPRTSKAIVIYSTMWGSTDLMARAIGEGLAAGGAHARLMPTSGVHRSDVATEMLDAGAIVLAAPTLNNEVFPAIADVMTYIKGLKPRGLIGAVVGSYGWSGEAASDLRKLLTEMKVELVGDEPIRCKFSPDQQTLSACYDLGRQIASRLMEKTAT